VHADESEIRQFELPTIERLGHDIYEQDQFAWKATDVLRSQKTDDELRADKYHGWIVSSISNHPTVRFVHVGASGPEVLCDVAFVSETPSSCEAPTDRTLTADEVAQYAARLTALGAIARPCSDRYNTVALKDPESDGWLVWALAATTQPDLVVFGGHYRFTISKDGKTLLRSDALSRGCLKMPLVDPNKGRPVMLFSIQLVSNIPVETNVWLNLLHKIAIGLATPDQKLWKIIDGHISADGEMPQQHQE